jgi:SAM-dependent methyltransferase
MKAASNPNPLPKPRPDYALGHAPVEIARLVDQAAILRPITTQLLKDAGIQPGMRVLDIGCGAGDVSFLAATLVGGRGTVLGIDRSENAIRAARARAGAAANLRFATARAEDLPPDASFDLVVGRYVLIFQEDPAALLRLAARLAGPSGVIAFHEIDDDDDFMAVPAVPAWTRANAWATRSFRRLFPSFDVAGRMVECFHEAGLAAPNLSCTVVCGDGAGSPIPGWLAGVVRTLLPQIVANGWATEEAADIDNLEALLRRETIAAHSQLTAPRQICAWLRVG